MPQQTDNPHLRALVRTLALSISQGNRDAAEEIVKWAYERDDVLFVDQAPIIVSNEPKITFSADVDEIYNAYPTKDYRNNGRLTHKGGKNKKQIEKLLKAGISKQHILNCIQAVTDDSSYLKDFTTFLNNLPCEADPQVTLDLSAPPKDDLHF